MSFSILYFHSVSFRLPSTLRGVTATAQRESASPRSDSLVVLLDSLFLFPKQFKQSFAFLNYGCAPCSFHFCIKTDSVCTLSNQCNRGFSEIETEWSNPESKQIAESGKEEWIFLLFGLSLCTLLFHFSSIFRSAVCFCWCVMGTIRHPFLVHSKVLKLWTTNILPYLNTRFEYRSSMADFCCCDVQSLHHTQLFLRFRMPLSIFVCI